jgi:putative ABC transport system substrate-binding protein
MGPAWRKLGYVDGETILLRSAEGNLQRIPVLINELIELGVDVLILVGPHTIKFAHNVVTNLPIVAIDLESDPVQAGYVESFSRPGRNITGLFMDLPGMAGKWVQLLKECAPAIDRIITLWDPVTGRSQVDAISNAGRSLGLETALLEVRHPSEAAAALLKRNPSRTTGVVQLGTPAYSYSDAPLMDTLKQLRLPSMFHLRRYVAAGGLMSYGPKLDAYFPQAVELVEKILAGANPADIPIRKPDQFDFVVNTSTAKALGLVVPPIILLQATEIVE